MRRILVVDDEKKVRDVLSAILSYMGYEVAVATSGNEGLELFLKHSFDLVLTDLSMPDMDGWTLAFHIKDTSPHTPVILITGEQREGVMEKLGASAVDSALFKPFGWSELQQTVQHVFNGDGDKPRYY
jgi:CheY-like chemotaxis protein